MKTNNPDGVRLINANALVMAFTESLNRGNEWFTVDLIRDCIDDAPTVDAVPVVCGRWIKVNTHLWKKDENGDIDTFAWESGFHNGPYCVICGDSPCKHCVPDWEKRTCNIGHFKCSLCGEVSKSGKENYCPNCGAKMNEQNGENNEID